MNYLQKEQTPYLFKTRKGTVEDPFIQIKENHTVTNAHCIQLSQVPIFKVLSTNNVSDIDGAPVSQQDYIQMAIKKNGLYMTQVSDSNRFLLENEYRVDYSNGLIFFNESMINISVEVEYIGKGEYYVSADRVFDYVSAEGTVLTLQSYLEKIKTFEENSTLLRFHSIISNNKPLTYFTNLIFETGVRSGLYWVADVDLQITIDSLDTKVTQIFDKEGKEIPMILNAVISLKSGDYWIMNDNDLTDDSYQFNISTGAYIRTTAEAVDYKDGTQKDFNIQTENHLNQLENSKIDLIGSVTGTSEKNINESGVIIYTINSSVKDNSHKHTIANVTGLPEEVALLGKVKEQSYTLKGNVTGNGVLTTDQEGNRTITFNTEIQNNSHNHNQSEITGLESRLEKIEGTGYTTESLAELKKAQVLIENQKINLTGGVTGVQEIVIDPTTKERTININTTVKTYTHGHVIGDVEGLSTELNTIKGDGYTGEFSLKSLNSYIGTVDNKTVTNASSISALKGSDANTAKNADKLGGVAANKFPQLDIANVFNGDVTVNGRFVATSVEAVEKVETKDAVVTLNKPTDGSIPSTIQSGIEVARPNTEDNQRIVLDSDDKWKLGREAGLQEIATRTGLVGAKLVRYDDVQKTLVSATDEEIVEQIGIKPVANATNAVNASNANKLGNLITEKTIATTTQQGFVTFGTSIDSSDVLVLDGTSFPTVLSPSVIRTAIADATRAEVSTVKEEQQIQPFVREYDFNSITYNADSTYTVHIEGLKQDGTGANAEYDLQDNGGFVKVILKETLDPEYTIVLKKVGTESYSISQRAVADSSGLEFNNFYTKKDKITELVNIIKADPNLDSGTVIELENYLARL